MVVNQTHGGCRAEFLGNLSRYRAAVDSVGMMMAHMVASQGGGAVAFAPTGNESLDWSCLQQIKLAYPSLAVGMCASCDSDPGSLVTVAANPPAMAAAVRAYKAAHPLLDEYWTDMESKYLGASQRAGVNRAFELASQVLPTTRYAGCEPRDPPYFGETCANFSVAAPSVLVQAANTYWSTLSGGGWYGGFEKLLQQEIDGIGGRVAALSPAICPACPSASEQDDDLSQQALYERMDLVCSKGIADLSGFTFTEIVSRTTHPDARGRSIGERWMEAFAYFRTGTKGQILV